MGANGRRWFSMSWSTDASGRKTWVPWIVGEPTSGQVPVWNTTRSRWEPSTFYPGATAHSDTRDPISTDNVAAGYAVGSEWLNTTKDRLWRCTADGDWLCMTDPGLVWEWNGTDLTQFDIVEEAAFTRTVTTWSSGPADAAIKIANPSTGTPCMAMLVKTTQLPPSFWTRASISSVSMSCRVNNNTPAGTQDLLTIPYYESMSYMVALRHTAAAATYTRRNGSTSWDDTSPGSGGDATKNTMSGAALRQAHQIKIPTGSTDPAVSFRGTPAPGATYINSFAGSWNAGWRGLTWSPRIGWGCRAFGTSSSGNYLGGMQIRLESTR